MLINLRLEHLIRHRIALSGADFALNSLVTLLTWIVARHALVGSDGKSMPAAELFGEALLGVCVDVEPDGLETRWWCLGSAI